MSPSTQPRKSLLSTDEITVPMSIAPLCSAESTGSTAALVTFHGHIESACREFAILATGLQYRDAPTIRLALRRLCVALLAAETLVPRVAPLQMAHARALMQAPRSVWRCRGSCGSGTPCPPRSSNCSRSWRAGSPERIPPSRATCRGACHEARQPRARSVLQVDRLVESDLDL